MHKELYLELKGHKDLNLAIKNSFNGWKMIGESIQFRMLPGFII